MTTGDALSISIEARESAKSAHHRLDRMNGSIDRLTVEVAKANATSEQILRRLDRDESFDAGAATVKRGFLDSRWRVIGIASAFLGSSLATTLFVLVARHHG